MFFRFFSYLKFLLESSNQHGVHSPFVYSFVTKGLYKKNNSKINISNYKLPEHITKKEEKILKKVIKYFKPLSIITNFKINSNTLIKDNNLLYFSSLNKSEVKEIYSKHSNSFIILKNIYKDKNSIYNWCEIINLQEATVTIDLFYFGLIFFRNGQRKEHFKIRV